MIGILTLLIKPFTVIAGLLTGLWKSLSPGGRRLVILLAVIGLAIAGVLYAKGQIREAEERAVLAELELAGQRTLQNGTEAALASQIVLTEKHKALQAAAKELKGELVVALAIAIAQRDTALAHASLPTQVDTVTGSRTAQFTDTTFAGIITGTVTAPPFPEPLGIALTIIRPAFTPSVGFVRVADRFVAVVNWQGEEYKIDAPFFEAPPPPRKRLEWFVEGGYLIGEVSAPVLSGGGSLGLTWGTRLEAALRATTATSALFIGLRKTF